MNNSLFVMQLFVVVDRVLCDPLFGVLTFN